MITLNEKEQRVYDYIVLTINEKGYAPSIRDIKSALGFKSTSTVHMYIAKLEQYGYIQKEDGKSRTLRVEDSSAERRQSTKIPILGKVTAGMPILAEENFDGFVDFCSSGSGYRSENLFALRVYGNSMIEAGILDGDIVIVDKREYAENGEIVVALVEDEATVKTFYKEGSVFRLQPENKDLKPIYSDVVDIAGKVVASLRFY